MNRAGAQAANDEIAELETARRWDGRRVGVRAAVGQIVEDSAEGAGTMKKVCVCLPLAAVLLCGGWRASADDVEDVLKEMNKRYRAGKP